MNAPVQTDWDPFEGSVPAHRDDVVEPSKGLKIPAWVSSIGIVAALLGFIVLFSHLLFDSEAVLFSGIALIVVGFAIAFGADIATKRADWSKWTLYRVARDNNWSFRAVAPPVTQDRERDESDAMRAKAIWQSRQMAKGMGMDDAAVKKLSRAALSIGAKEKVYDPLVAVAYERMGTLMAARPGQPIPIVIEALYRGRTTNGVPFWMGAQLTQTVMIAATKELKTDARGNTANHGHGIAMLLAFPLDRDTGIRADLLAEALGDSRKDFDTESMEFNSTFNVKLLNGEERQADLFRVLTPATQAAMLDLAKRYRAQFAIDHDTIFMAGYDLLNIEDPAAVAEIMAQVVDEFASAATSFKHYAE